jgi:DNA-binding winged helix-turn-helix (wHTH) protein
MSPSPQWHFDPCRLDPDNARLWRGDYPVALTRKAFSVLHYLVTHAGQLVTKEALLDAIWPETAVSDAALRVVISELRKALGDTAQAPQFIATVYCLGYRFLAPVTRIDSSAEALEMVPPFSIVPSILQDHRLEESRLVTVLCGVLPHATTVQGAEVELADLPRLMPVVYDLALREVQRYEGVVQHVRDDGFLALFGVQGVQEDHAQRAVRAALGLQQLLHESPDGLCLPSGETLALRLALHTGLVVDGPLEDSPQQTSVTGENTTTLAELLARQAMPGILVASDATIRLVPGEIHAVALAPISVEGYPTPIPVYQVLQLLQQCVPPATTMSRPRSPFVGRDGELAVLYERLALVERSQGQVVGIVGESGIGKSRLLHEFRQGLRTRQVTYVQGRCLSYGMTIPYLPVLDLLRATLQITEVDSAAVIAAKVSTGLQTRDLVPDAWAPYLLPLLGIEAEPARFVGVDPEVLKAWTFEALHQLSFSSGQQQPYIMAVEDVQWIDATSDAYLAALAERLAGFPILLLVTFRPGYRPAWLSTSYTTQVALQPLGPDDSRQVVRAIRHDTPLPIALEQQLLAKAEGHPFFLEELVHTVLEEGGGWPAHTVPATVREALAARIDRLPPLEKRILQTAAVIGMEVPFALLDAIIPLPEETWHESLAHLQTAAFLSAKRLMPERVYTFKHALVQEVAYGSLLETPRRIMHE